MRFRLPALILGALFVPLVGALPALAAVPQGFSHGMAGPLLNYVHLLGLLGLGLWLDMQGRGTPGPGAALALGAGLLLGVMTRMGLHLPYTALALEASLVVTGVLLAATITLPSLIGLALAGMVGALHGINLGQWGGPVTGAPLFWPGMLTGCVLLVTAGVGLSATLYPLGSGKASRIAGGIVALAGLALLLNLM